MRTVNEKQRARVVERIRRAAERVFAARGYSGATMEMVARRAGLAKTSLYHYFPGKRALYADLLERALTALEQLAAEKPVAAGDPSHVLRLVQAYLMRQRHLLGLLLPLHAAGQRELRQLVGPRLAGRVLRVHRRVFAGLPGLAESLQVGPELRELIESFMLGLGLKLQHGRGELAQAELALLERLLAGARQTTGRAPAGGGR